eukprot:scaffold83460_cov66-Cyclotella_meneghiniana.AAC.7
MQSRNPSSGINLLRARQSKKCTVVGVFKCIRKDSQRQCAENCGEVSREGGGFASLLEGMVVLSREVLSKRIRSPTRQNSVNKRFASLASRKFLVCSRPRTHLPSLWRMLVCSDPMADFVHPKAVVFAQSTYGHD